MVEIDKYINVVHGNLVAAKQTGEVQIKMRDENGEPFIDILYNLLLAPEFCNQLFSIIASMNLVHTCIFHKGFCTIFFSDKEQNAVTLPHIKQIKHAFW